ncbi:hypothetical protein M0R45_014874 [Rubus argutus]|uniref:RING-type E3 ubiquitin transferase n=1 Tax=Rubus argutus TaxID=59490 RepID=A0AAW1XNV8_RUBAR
MLSLQPYCTINAQPTTRSGSSSSSSSSSSQNNMNSSSYAGNHTKKYKLSTQILGTLILILMLVFAVMFPFCNEIISCCAYKLFPRRDGLDPAVIESFPVFLYSAVKGLTEQSAPALECAVCLSEFGDSETLRLLPKCDHVFHPGCIDVWLAYHNTCPVCRANLTSCRRCKSNSEVSVSEIRNGSTEQVEVSEGRSDAGAAVVVNVVNEKESDETCRDKYTLRLPEEVRRQLVPN